MEFEKLTGKFIARDDGFIGYGETEVERDVFSFVLADDSRVIIDAKAKSFSLDAKLELFDVAGNLIATNDNTDNPASPNPSDSQISVQDVPAGDYFVAVSGANQTTGEYRVAVRVDTVPVGLDDVGNSIIAASIFEMDPEPGISFARATIDYGEDRDFYRFIANQSGKLIVRSKALGENSTLNTVLRAYDANGQKIAANNNFRDKLDSRFVLSVTQGEEYSIQLSSVGDTTGDYRVSLRFKQEDPDADGGFGVFGRSEYAANLNLEDTATRIADTETLQQSLVRPQYDSGLLAPAF